MLSRPLHRIKPLGGWWWPWRANRRSTPLLPGFTAPRFSSTGSSSPIRFANSAHTTPRAYRRAVRWPESSSTGQKTMLRLAVAMEGKPPLLPPKPAPRLHRAAHYLQLLRIADIHRQQYQYIVGNAEMWREIVRKQTQWQEEQRMASGSR